MKIWKFKLFEGCHAITSAVTIEMPKGAKVLSVKNQNGNLCLWALCDSRDTVMRTFDIIGTDNPINKTLGTFVGTCIMEDFVWHIFESMGPV